MMTLTLYDFDHSTLRDSVVVFTGQDEEGDDWKVALDHRCAVPIVMDIADDTPVDVDVESYQILGRCA